MARTHRWRRKVTLQLAGSSSLYAATVKLAYQAGKYFLFQKKHYLAFQYAKQQKEIVSTLKVFCNLQIYAAMILSFILKALKENSVAIWLNTHTQN